MTATTDTAQGSSADRHRRIAIVGSGFAGLGLAIRLQQTGRDDFVVFERAADLGGTWRDNTYPGCQCDVPSRLYSFSFAPKADWSRTYAPRAEIQQYLLEVADRFKIRRFIRFSHEVRDARWDEPTQRWHIETSQGSWTADIIVGAHGGLSAPSYPEIPGLENFGGAVFHTARWDSEHDFTGERVAILGTGASAIQVVPRLQPTVQQLTVFQRTAPWVLPHTDRPVRAWEHALYRRVPGADRLMRTLVYWLREATFIGFRKRSWLTRRMEALGRKHLEHQVPDPVLRAKLTPTFEPGCKRLLLSNHYYRALSRDNADVVTEPIREVTPHAIVTADGAQHPVDTIVLATGFKVTNHPVLELIYGRDGRSLAKTWADTGMRSYLGTTVNGFPNLFLLSGPNTGIGHNSLLLMIESQFAYVLDCLQQMDQRGLGSVEVRQNAVDAFADEVARKTAPTVWASGCASWYLDDHGRNTVLWPDWTWRYRLRTRRFDMAPYDVTVRSDTRVAA
jgi:cation diffusion facilitator CzcD-associated flavoprotein CzcO